MIQLNTKPGDKLLELGGGSRPMLKPKCMGGDAICVDVRPCYDEQGQQTVDFTANFEEPLPIQDNEFDGVFSQYALEHVSWRKIPQFIREIHRVLKPGGKAVIVTANTAAQLDWIKAHPEGWDGKSPFESFSCVLFGDNDYPENSHKAFMSPQLAVELFRAAGFDRVTTIPYGERETDLVIEAVKSQILVKMISPETLIPDKPFHLKAEGVEKKELTREEMFDKEYFNGGRKVGGYSCDNFGRSYADFPVHELTFRHVMARHPKSVLELGAGRGYIVKRLQDQGIPATGLEISKHCFLTRVANEITQCDVCGTWPFNRIKEGIRDLCFSIAFMEHVPREFLPDVIQQMAGHCKRGLHGIDFGSKDDGFDRTHCLLQSREAWIADFQKYAPGWPVEIVDKEELERGEFPLDVLNGDGKIKLNVGCNIHQFHHAWINLDVLNLSQFAAQNRYNFQQVDAKAGLPFGTGTVDLIFSSHFLEHLTYGDGLSFLRECRRIIKPNGAIRIVCPDARLLMKGYVDSVEFNPTPEKPRLNDFDEINNICSESPTAAGKLWSLLFSGHQAAYDEETLSLALKSAGFKPFPANFRETQQETVQQILRETTEMGFGLSLFMDGIPLVG